MTKKKKKIFKKKGNIVKDLTRNIFKILKENPNTSFNYKQIAAKIKISDTDGKSQIIKKLAELAISKQIKEVLGFSFRILNIFLVKSFTIFPFFLNIFFFFLVICRSFLLDDTKLQLFTVIESF